MWNDYNETEEDKKYNKDMEWGLQQWIHDTHSEDKVAEVKATEIKIEQIKDNLSKTRKELDRLVDELPKGMGGWLGFRYGSIVSTPQEYVLARDEGISLIEARKLYRARIMAVNDRHMRTAIIATATPPEEDKG